MSNSHATSASAPPVPPGPCPPCHSWLPGAGGSEDSRFPWYLFYAVTGAVIAGHVLFGSLHSVAAEHVPGWARILVPLVLLAYSALVLHAERLEPKPPLGTIAVAAFCISFAGLEAHHTLEHTLPPWLVIAIGAAAFAITLRLAHHWRHDLERGRSLHRTPALEYRRQHPIRALILTVSSPDSRKGDNVEILAEGASIRARFTSAGKPPVDVTGPDIDAAIEALAPLKPNWQQLLRAIRRHHTDGASLEYVTLYGSPDSRLETCRTFLGLFLPGVEFRILPPVAMEDFEAVHDLLRTEVESLLHGGIRPEQLAIDITGGVKIPSIAGAVLTLNRAVVCQYVQSVGSEADRQGNLDAFIYDFRWDKSLELPA